MKKQLTMAELYKQTDEQIASKVRQFIDFHNESVSDGAHTVSTVVAIGADGVVLKFITDEKEWD